MHVLDGDKAERKFKKRQTDELKNEHNSIQTKLDTLMDFLLDGTISKEDFDRKKQLLKDQLADVQTREKANKDDDNVFSNSLISLVNLISTAYKCFCGSTIEKKRLLLNLMFSNLSLKGRSLCYCLDVPFDIMALGGDFESWRLLIDRIRTNPEMRKAIIKAAKSIEYNGL